MQNMAHQTIHETRHTLVIKDIDEQRACILTVGKTMSKKPLSLT